jgi:hypothetical protein
MLAVLQKIDVADAKHFDGLRESAKQDKQAKAEEKTRKAAHAVERRSVAKKAVAAREAKRKKK